MLFKFIKKQYHVENIWSLFFKPEDDYRFIEGQFLEMNLDLKHVDDRGSKRWFTISSTSDDQLIRITTRYSLKPSSFKKELFKLKKDQTINCSLAMGDFILPKDKNIPIVFVAVGIGITPFISMINKLNSDKQKREINLLYHVSDPDNYLFSKEFQYYPFHKFFTTDENFTAEYILSFSNNNLNQHYYLAGPEVLMEQLSKELVLKGVPKNHLVTDYFPGYN